MSNLDRFLLSGFVRVHILHHAAQESIFGQGIAEELRRHGYQLSAGTLYPLLHDLERKGYLRSKEHRQGKRMRRFYRATPKGKAELAVAKHRVRELFGELFEE
jgi:PadR family transcriptional regulator, regulatory protein PadR